MTGRFTGWHMAAVLVGFFGVIITVNLVMARLAIGTFGGIVVQNTYAASQEFNGWLAAAKDQDKLGWDAVTAWRPDGRLAVTVRGPGDKARLTGAARHPLGRQPDVALTFDSRGNGRFLSRQALADGRWTVRLELAEGEQVWRREEQLQ